MFYDMHIHSALSPCAMDDMSCNNIVNMALLKGLELISVTDHNSMSQQRMMAETALKAGLRYICGAEVQTREEVHVLCYFTEIEKAEAFGTWIISVRQHFPNNPHFFGNQYLFNADDEVIGHEEDCLIFSLEASLEEVIDAIHRFSGKAVLAHIIERKNGVMSQLGFIPKDLPFDGLEVTRPEQIDKVLKLHPWIKDPIFFMNSDAHTLIDISEAEHNIEETTWNKFWRYQR